MLEVAFTREIWLIRLRFVLSGNCFGLFLRLGSLNYLVLVLVSAKWRIQGWNLV